MYFLLGEGGIPAKVHKQIHDRYISSLPFGASLGSCVSFMAITFGIRLPKVSQHLHQCRRQANPARCGRCRDHRHVNHDA